MSDNVEKWREEFELIFGAEYSTNKNIDPDQDSYYEDNFLDLIWEGFLAAKQSQPLLELPKKYIYGCVYDVDQIHEALTAAGIPYKIKGE